MSHSIRDFAQSATGWPLLRAEAAPQRIRARGPRPQWQTASFSGKNPPRDI